MAGVDKLLSLLEHDNVANKVKDSVLDELADKVLYGYKIDRDSRKEWEDRCEEAIKFSKQLTEPKNFPWEGSSNVIFPLLTLASMSFASKTYPEIIKDNRIVRCIAIGSDQDESKYDRANRVSSHMSYQRLIQSDTWEPDTDKLLHMLPVIGTCFRKVYYDPVDDISQSDLCSPQDIVVNYNVPSLEKAPRITHRYFLSKNEIIEKQRNGYFLDIDLDELSDGVDNEHQWHTDLDEKRRDPEDEEGQNYEFLEQHTHADLDGDGYAEPWIIVVHKASEKVVGIFPRFDIENVKTDPNTGEILRIVPTTYFVDYHFLRSPDGGFYSLGYGHLLFPLNEAINSLMNQLIDSGTLSNTNAGLISRQLKLKGGKIEFKMGEYVPVEVGSTGKIADSIHEFRFNPPSPVLFQLLGLVINSAKEIASINEILTGDAKPQNSPAHSVMELSNQGMKLYNAIAKRLYRSLKKEFELLYGLNYKYLDPETYFTYHDKQMAVSSKDYDPNGMNVAPVADPNMSSEIQKSMQAQAISQLLQNQAILPEMKINNIVREFFEALKIPKEKVDKFVFTAEEKQAMQQQQGPNPEMIKMQLEMQKAQNDFEIKSKQQEAKTTELQIKLMDLIKKYEIKEAETDERQAKLLADAHLKQANVDNMNEKLEIERKKAEAALTKAKKQ